MTITGNCTEADQSVLKDLTDNDIFIHDLPVTLTETRRFIKIIFKAGSVYAYRTLTYRIVIYKKTNGIADSELVYEDSTTRSVSFTKSGQKKYVEVVINTVQEAGDYYFGLHVCNENDHYLSNASDEANDDFYLREKRDTSCGSAPDTLGATVRDSNQRSWFLCVEHIDPVLDFDSEMNMFPDNISVLTTAAAIETWLDGLSITTLHSLKIRHIKGFYVAKCIYE